jgi:uncharacterized protein YndB with AHSA1/START domain
MSSTNPSTAEHDTVVTADEKVPGVHIERIFDATPAQLFRAHTDPVLVAQWLGPHDLEMTVDTWDCRSGGEYHYTHRRVGESGLEEYGFRGCFHEVSPTKLVQTFAFEGSPESVALETMTFESLGDGRTKLHAFALVDSFEGRDQFLASGMESGVNEGYEKLDELIATGGL